MRIAIVGDIHGNTIALRAALEAIGERSVDLIVCLGDLAANGPDPAGAVERIADLGCAVVAGNTDIDMVDVPEWWADPSAAGAPEWSLPVFELSRWCAEQLTEEHRAYLASLPATLEVGLEGGTRLLAFHGSPQSCTDVIEASTTHGELEAMLGNATHELLVGGHTHVPLVRSLGGQMLINPGSVGLPFTRYGPAGQVPVSQHAAFGVITTEQGGATSVELASVPLDEELLASQARNSGMPHAEWWLALRSAR